MLQNLAAARDDEEKHIEGVRQSMRDLKATEKADRPPMALAMVDSYATFLHAAVRNAGKERALPNLAEYIGE